jgi:hypothetical protein
MDDFSVDIEFEEVTKLAYEVARKNASAIKVEEKLTETMWFCPHCKIFMMTNEDSCI